MGQIFQWGDWGYRSAFALLLWIPFSLWLFKRERATRAGAHVLIWSMMWLPEEAAFDFPALPPFSKYSIAALCALAGLYWTSRRRLRAAKIGRGYDLIVIVMVLGQIGAVLTNGDPLSYGNWKTIHLPAYTAYDGISTAVRDIVTVLVPLILGRALIRSRRDLHDVLVVLVIGGLVYSLPIFWELRMSPMLHHNVYGFFPRDDWSQNLRLGGYRPTVFMGHGLVVGFFMFLAVTAAITLHKAGKRALLGVPMGYIIAYLFVVLLLVKATAALLYGLIGLCLIRFLTIKNQMRVMLFLAFVVVSYPLSRMTNIFPTESVLSVAKSFGADRVQSLQFRFDNEDLLILKGVERWVFGWGGFGRERVYDEETGKDLVIQDGAWIAQFGTHGTLGFLCYFAVLILPLWQAARGLKRVRSQTDRTLLGGLAFIVTVCCVNTLPNMALPNLQFVFAAALAVIVKEMPRRAALLNAPPRTPEVPAQSGIPAPPVAARAARDARRYYG
ncbi:MAG TPA: hypothetical protein VMF89_34085 [Polyangiales bacterium]|nr:hypothetical protein [Polyangiales bacterium]